MAHLGRGGGDVCCDEMIRIPEGQPVSLQDFIETRSRFPVRSSAPLGVRSFMLGDELSG
jgi:hypothetical protein